MSVVAAAEAETISFDELASLLRDVLLNAGASAEVAEVIGTNCASCERDGAQSHGIFRIPGYLGSIATKWVNPAAVPAVEDTGGSFLRVDAGNGFAQPALAAVAAQLEQRATDLGMAMVAIRNSHHLSALWPDVEPFADKGFLALSMVNSFACTVPFDGRSAVLGTNPIAFAAPRADAPPITVDLATSALANGDVQLAAREGRQLRPGEGVDAEGAPTTDPRKVLDGGALLPFGGHKGSSLSMMVELFGAALSGGKFSYEVDWSNHPGATTPHTGQIVILISPDFGRQMGVFASRSNELVERMRASGVSRFPGDRRLVARRRSLSDGIVLSSQKLNDLRQLAHTT